MNNAQRIAQAILDIDTTLGVADMQSAFRRLWDEAETLGVHSEVDAILQAHHLKEMRESMEMPTLEEALLAVQKLRGLCYALLLLKDFPGRYGDLESKEVHEDLATREYGAGFPYIEEK